MNLDGDLARFSRGQRVFVKQAAVFIDDGIRAQAGPFDVKLFVIGELLRLLAAEIVAEEVHHTFAVADEINRVPIPHRKHVHAVRLRQFLVRVVFQVVDGDGKAPPAAVALPGAKFLRSLEVSDLRAVGRERGELAAGHRQHFCRAALRRNEEQARRARGRRADAVRAKEDVFAIRRPTEHDVARRMKRQAARLAAVGGDDVHVGVAVVLAGKGDPFAVGREFRKQLVARMRGKPARVAAGARSDPDIARVGEDGLIF